LRKLPDSDCRLSGPLITSKPPQCSQSSMATCWSWVSCVGSASSQNTTATLVQYSPAEGKSIRLVPSRQVMR
jgi:hypothetical protein